MGRLDGESDTIKDLCVIRKPVAWHRDEAPSGSLKDHLDESHDNLEHSRRDDSKRSNEDSVVSVDDERSPNDSESLQSQHSQSNIDPVDDDGSEVHARGFDTDSAQ